MQSAPLRWSSLALLALVQPVRAQEALYEIRGTRRAPLDGSVVAVGDLDHDGATDWLAGGTGGAFSGRTGKPLFGPVGLGPVEGQAGNVGDVDGDGFDDLLLFGYQVFSGRELLPADHRSRFRLLTQLGPNPRVQVRWIGNAVVLQDLDGDGVRELCTGWPDLYVQRCGGDQLVVQHGETGGFAQVSAGGDGQLFWESEGLAHGDALGGIVARVGDLDADGLDDVLAVTRWPASQTFCSQLDGGGYLQARSARTGTLLWTLAEFPVAGAPIAAAAMDDVNGDSVPDLALGFVWSQPIEVRSGADGSLLWTLAAPGNVMDFFGSRLYPLDDLDGDGIRELVIAAPQPSVRAPAPGPGYVRIVSGLGGATLATLRGRTVGAQFGSSVAVLGDVNGDGRPELAVGSPWEGGWGAVQVFSLRLGPAILRRR